MGETLVSAQQLPSSIRLGEVIGAKYRLERELGRGAMGTVWLAQHVTLGQRVAIKLISAEHAQSVEARQRFATEAKAAARLKSRHVVQVYDHGETGAGIPYIVMEYLEGETLEARLERERELPLVDSVRITAQVARALARAHAQGVVHRDLKPGNIFLTRNDEDELGWTAKVLDFGIAKLDEASAVSSTRAGIVLGTPLFMSPEQVRAPSSADARSDLYSLGICFFNIVSGRFAFDGESFADVLISICTEPLPDIKQAVPSIPDAVADWFVRCCARDPSQRFQSADELLEGLKLAVGSTLPLLSRGSVPEELRGPFGTIRGHSGPLSPRTAAAPDDSAAFLLRYRTPAPDSTPTDRADPHARTARSAENQTEGATSVLTVREEATASTRPQRTTLLIGLTLVALCLAGLSSIGLLSREGKSAREASSAGDFTPNLDTVTQTRDPSVPGVGALGTRINSATPAPSVTPLEPRAIGATPVASASSPQPASLRQATESMSKERLHSEEAPARRSPPSAPRSSKSKVSAQAASSGIHPTPAGNERASNPDLGF